MIKDKSYIHGTAARKLEYDVYKENKVLSAKRKQRNNNKIKVKYVFALLLVFCLGCFVMYRYVQITEQNYKIDKQIIQYNEIKNENVSIKVDIESSMDLRSIEKKAQELGLQRPDRHQIVYVSVPRNNSALVLDDVKLQEENEGIFRSLLSNIKKVGSFLY
ncbi:UNVERIFIED_CONTAM: hypothetical protein Cloal_4104 [Acetivibrio alkalicellulosi]